MQGSALAARGGGQTVHGFEVAGDDRRFHPARAEIAGDTLMVTSGAVAQPKAVRYAWRDNPADADLVNREGLPASPFRTATARRRHMTTGEADAIGDANRGAGSAAQH